MRDRRMKFYDEANTGPPEVAWKLMFTDSRVTPINYYSRTLIEDLARGKYGPYVGPPDWIQKNKNTTET